MNPQKKPIVLTAPAAALSVERTKIVFIVLPPHSSDQTQPLDLGVFAAVKRYYMNPINVRISRKEWDPQA
jgi:hypothetical protein